MVTQKFEDKLVSFIILLFFLLFPLGVLPAQTTSLKLHPLDALVGFTSLIYIVKTRFLPRKYLFPIVVVVMTTLFSPFTIGVLYLLRLCSYLMFVFAIKWAIDKKLFLQGVLTELLLYVSAAIATIGLVQYLLVPDLRALKLYGWDDHYYRLVSTFLDPAFAGILLVLGIILSVFLYHKRKNSSLLFVLLLLSTALGLTYSRSSFLSLGAGLAMYYGLRKWRMAIASLLIIIGAIGLLPTSAGGEGVNLARTSSISAKSLNFVESVKIISSSPLFGVGMNNICEARVKLFDYPRSSHACAGLDNSILFILATTGIVGLIAFAYLLYQFHFDSYVSQYHRVLVSSFVAVIVHSMFTNTLFYPWVMGWMAVMLGVSLSTSQTEP